MTRRRKLILTLSAFAIAAVAGFLALCLSAPRHRVNVDNIRRFHNGMTRADVEAILGVPSGDYSNGGIVISHFVTIRGFSGGVRPQVKPPVECQSWVADEYAVDVCFDASGKVVGVSEYLVVKVPRESMIAKFRRWLGL